VQCDITSWHSWRQTEAWSSEPRACVLQDAPERCCLLHSGLNCAHSLVPGFQGTESDKEHRQAPQAARRRLARWRRRRAQPLQYAHHALVLLQLQVQLCLSLLDVIKRFMASCSQTTYCASRTDTLKWSRCRNLACYGDQMACKHGGLAVQTLRCKSAHGAAMLRRRRLRVHTKHQHLT
jgi:hypothetical protein